VQATGTFINDEKSLWYYFGTKNVMNDMEQVKMTIYQYRKV